MDKRICTHCSASFAPSHFNQGLCSPACKSAAARIRRAKYKASPKGQETEQRWINSDHRKTNEKGYRGTPLARSKAVVRTRLYLERHEHAREAKKRRDRIYLSCTQGRMRSWYANQCVKGCAKCGSFERLSVDHIVPISSDGKDTVANLQVLCTACNSTKGAKWEG